MVHTLGEVFFISYKRDRSGHYFRITDIDGFGYSRRTKTRIRADEVPDEQYRRLIERSV